MTQSLSPKGKVWGKHGREVNTKEKVYPGDGAEGLCGKGIQEGYHEGHR